MHHQLRGIQLHARLSPRRQKHVVSHMVVWWWFTMVQTKQSPSTLKQVKQRGIYSKWPLLSLLFAVCCLLLLLLWLSPSAVRHEKNNLQPSAVYFPHQETCDFLKPICWYLGVNRVCLFFLTRRHPSTSWKGVLGMLLGSKYLLRRCLDV